jgi:chromosome segregation ATPase
MNQDQSNEKLIRKHDLEKKQYQQDFQAFKVKVQERDQKLAQEYQNKYDLLKNEMEKVNSKFQERIKAFDSANNDLRKALEETRRSNGSTIEETRRKYEHEIKCLKDQFQIDMNMKIQEAKDEVYQAMKSQYEKELGQVRASLTGDKQEGLMALKRDYDEKFQSQRDEYQLKLDKAYNDWKCLQDELHQQESKLINLQNEHSRYLQDLQGKHSNQLDEKDNQLKHLLNEISIKKNEILTQVAKVSEREEEIQRLNKLITEKNNVLVQLEEQLKKSKDELLSLQSSLQAMNQNGSAKDQAYQHEINEKEKEIVRLQNEIDNHQQKMRKLEQSKLEMEKSLDLQSSEAKNVIRALEVEKLALQQQLDDFKQSAHNASDLASKELSELCQRMQSREEMMLKERQELEGSQRNALQALTAKHTAEMEEKQLLLAKQEEQYSLREKKLLADLLDLKEKSSMHVDDIEKRFKSQQQDVEDRLTQQINSLQANYDDLQANYQKTKDELQVQAELFKQYKGKSENQLSSLQTDLDVKKRELAAMEASMAKLKQQIENMTDEMTAKENFYHSKLTSSSSTMQSEWQRRLDEQIENDRIALLQAVENAQIVAANDLIRIKKLHEDEVATLKKLLQVEADKTLHESATAEHEKLRLLNQLKEEKDRAMNEINDLKAKYLEREKQLQEDKKAAIDAMRKEYQGNKKEQETEMMKRFDDELSSMKLTHEKAMSSLADQHKQTLQQALKDAEDTSRRSRQELEYRLSAEHRAALDERDKQHGRLVHDLQDKHGGELKKVDDELKSLNQRYDQLDSLRAKLEISLKEHQESYESALIKHAQELQTLSKQHDNQLQEERIIADGKMNSIREQHLVETNALKAEHQDALMQLSGDISKLQQACSLLDQKYKNRESRVEDVQRIAMLEREMIEKDALVAKTRDEMLYFKREMLNREENYNQKFNRNPVVGVMQVIKPKDMDNVSVTSKGHGSRSKPAALNTSNTKATVPHPISPSGASISSPTSRR